MKRLSVKDTVYLRHGDVEAVGFFLISARSSSCAQRLLSVNPSPLIPETPLLSIHIYIWFSRLSN